jgi:hypothetical protein
LKDEILRCAQDDSKLTMSFVQCLRIIWAAPISAPAFAVAAFNLMFGGRLRRCGIALEATGGAMPMLLKALGPHRSIAAITLGHVILARSDHEAARWRMHEHAHVRQYERWGMVFPFAYAAASLFAWSRGRDMYWDNGFEVEARAAEISGERKPSPRPSPK